MAVKQQHKHGKSYAKLHFKAIFLF